MKPSDEDAFENAIKSLEATAANVGLHLEIDSTARRIYAREIRAMSDSLRREVASGKLTWTQAAEQAQSTRNPVMQLTRSRTTPVARAFAERTKAEARGLNALVAGKTLKLFGKPPSSRSSPRQGKIAYLPKSWPRPAGPAQRSQTLCGDCHT